MKKSLIMSLLLIASLSAQDKEITREQRYARLKQVRTNAVATLERNKKAIAQTEGMLAMLEILMVQEEDVYKRVDKLTGAMENILAESSTKQSNKSKQIKRINEIATEVLKESDDVLPEEGE